MYNNPKQIQLTLDLIAADTPLVCKGDKNESQSASNLKLFHNDKI
jgi:hypothetical protein